MFFKTQIKKSTNSLVTIIFTDLPVLILTISLFTILSSCSKDISKSYDTGKSIIDLSKSKTSEIDTSNYEAVAKDFVIAGSSLQQRNRYAEAILEYQQALRYDSAYTIFYSIAKCYKELDKLDLALEYTLKAVEKDPEFLPALELAAEIHLLRFDIQIAATIYEQILKISPSKENQYTMARIYEFIDPSKAIDIYYKLLLESDDQGIINRILQMAEKDEDKTKYGEMLKTLFEKYPSNQIIGYNYIIFLALKNNFIDAVNTLEILEKSMPEDKYVSVILFLGNTLLQKDTAGSEETIKLLLKIIDNKSDSGILNVFAGHLSEKTGDSANAEKYFLRAAKVADTSSENTMHAAFFYMRHKNNSSAMQLLQNSLNRFPKDYKIPLYIAYLYSDSDSTELAFNAVFQALAIDSMQIEPWTLLGSLYDKLGNKPDSVDYCYQKALAIDPDDPLANNNYAYSICERENGDLNKALLMSEKSIAADSLNTAYLDTYGWIQYKLGNYRVALDYIQKSIETGKASAEVFEHLGDIYIMLDRKSEAIDAFKKSLELDPGRDRLLKRIESIK